DGQAAAAVGVADDGVPVLAHEIDDARAVRTREVVVAGIDVANDFGSAPAGRRMVGIAPVAEPELELMVAARRRLERAAAHVDDVPRLARGVSEPRAVRVIGVGVDGAVLVGAAARREAVAPAVPRVLAADEQIRTERVVVLDLPQPVKRMQDAGLRIEVALIPEKR